MGIRTPSDRKNEYCVGGDSDNTPYEKIGTEVRSIADELPFDIPDTWEWVRLCHLGCFSSGKTPSMSDKTLWGTDTMWVTSKDMKVETITSSEIMLSEKGAAGLKKYPAGTLLMVARSGILRRLLPICTLGIESTINQDIKAFELFDTSLSELILYFLKGQEIEILRDYVKSVTTVESLKFDEFQNMLFPLPPKEEQTRILNKIRELRPLWEAYEKAENERMSQNEEFPARLRKSILQQAVQGKLVPQNPADEPASNLLERIRIEKEWLIKTGKIKRDKHESIIFRRDNSHYEKRGSEVVCIDDEIPFELPETWSWSRLSSFGVFSSGKTPSMSNPEFWNGTIPWVSSKDMKRPVIIDSEMHITELAAESMQIYPAGTLLLVSRSGILRRLLPLCVLGVDSTINQDIKAFTLYDLSLSQWLYYAIKAFEPYILKELVKSVTTVESLKFGEFERMLIPVPPESEQVRIIAEIKEALSLIRSVYKELHADRETGC
ncbi:MAG: restriction endonuclease subunit S [Candidatus Faecousia sp.]|nr:restriction endonuclease subunit S [Candidatus Faecousia sp.]